MTGRDFIIYILSYGLEDTNIINEDGMIIGFMTDMEAAAKFGVGAMTIARWVNDGLMNGVRINNTLMVPVDVKDPRKSSEENSHENKNKVITELDLCALNWHHTVDSNC